MHLMNRGCSSEDIDLDFFRLTWPDQPVKMTVSRETLPSLAAGIIHLQERGFKVHANLGYGIPWNRLATRDVFPASVDTGRVLFSTPRHPPVSLLLLESKSFSTTSIPSSVLRHRNTYAMYDVYSTTLSVAYFTPLVLSRAKPIWRATWISQTLTI